MVEALLQPVHSLLQAAQSMIESGAAFGQLLESHQDVPVH
jgi:hypothetical protein